MADYKSMYEKLFNTITDTISVLQNAQVEAEEMFVSQEDTNVTLLKPSNNKPE